MVFPQVKFLISVNFSSFSLNDISLFSQDHLECLNLVDFIEPMIFILKFISVGFYYLNSC